MTRDHDALRARLGPVGAWTFAFDALPMAGVAEGARAIESLGVPPPGGPGGGGSREI